MGTYLNPAITPQGFPHTGLYFISAGPANPAGGFCFSDLNGQVAGCMDDEGYRYGATGAARWSSAAIQGNFAWDNGGLTTANTHDGTLAVCNGSCADNDHNGNIVATNFTAYGSLKAVPSVFSALAACSSTTEGTFRAVTDSTSDIWGAVIAGGGSFHVLAYCNGSTWSVR